MATLETFADFDAMLQSARAELARMAAADPGDGAIAAVQRQLDALHAMSRGGRIPDPGEKACLDFGMIASRALDACPVADDLYALASFVTWWGEPGRPV